MMREGDCVLQPPGIKHRVLESSAGLEVIEVACPAEHETTRDHEIDLPTDEDDASEPEDPVSAGAEFRLRNIVWKWPKAERWTAAAGVQRGCAR